MKKLMIVLSLFLSSFISNAQTKLEFMQLNTIESVVPGGLGRSRMISTTSNGMLEETKLENFFSLGFVTK